MTTLVACVPKTPKLVSQLGRDNPNTDKQDPARTNARTDKPDPTCQNVATDNLPPKRPSDRIDKQLATCTTATTLTPLNAATLVRAPKIDS